MGQIANRVVGQDGVDARDLGSDLSFHGAAGGGLSDAVRPTMWELKFQTTCGVGTASLAAGSSGRPGDVRGVLGRRGYRFSVGAAGTDCAGAVPVQECSATSDGATVCACLELRRGGQPMGGRAGLAAREGKRRRPRRGSFASCNEDLPGGGCCVQLWAITRARQPVLRAHQPAKAPPPWPAKSTAVHMPAVRPGVSGTLPVHSVLLEPARTAQACLAAHRRVCHAGVALCTCRVPWLARGTYRPPSSTIVDAAPGPQRYRGSRSRFSALLWG
jgi:hypothetical protein